MNSNYFSKEIQKDLRIIGWYQITGGLCGLFILIKGIVDDVYYSNSGSVLYSLVIVAFIFSTFCGFICLLSNKNAIGFSMINQGLQSIVFSIGGVIYCFLAGPFFTIGFSLNHFFHFSLDWGLAKFQFFIGMEESNTFLSINISSLLLLYWLYHLKKQVALEKSIDAIDNVGQQTLQ